MKFVCPLTSAGFNCNEEKLFGTKRLSSLRSTTSHEETTDIAKKNMNPFSSKLANSVYCIPTLISFTNPKGFTKAKPCWRSLPLILPHLKGITSNMARRLIPASTPSLFRFFGIPISLLLSIAWWQSFMYQNFINTTKQNSVIQIRHSNFTVYSRINVSFGTFPKHIPYETEKKILTKRMLFKIDSDVFHDYCQYCHIYLARRFLSNFRLLSQKLHIYALQQLQCFKAQLSAEKAQNQKTRPTPIMT